MQRNLHNETDHNQHDADRIRLIDTYNMYFDIVAADTPQLLEKSFALRYQVYCLEAGFENKEDFKDGLEIDPYDKHSVSSLLYHKHSGDMAGSVRLILPHHNSEKIELPVFGVSEDICQLSEEILPRSTTAEISRFSISKKFRRRNADDLYPQMPDATNAQDGSHKRVIPNMMIGLLQASVRMSVANDITHLTIIVEPTLQRLLRQNGLDFIPVGPMIEHHGRRKVLYRKLDDLLNDLYSKNFDVWEVITDCGRLWPYKGTYHG